MLTLHDLAKVASKLRQWARPAHDGRTLKLPKGLSIVHPWMWPGFRSRWQRRLNAMLISRGVNRALGPRRPGEYRVAVTTLPITADLVGRLDVDRWVYYCVDDFSVWPGLDGPVLQAMERDLVSRVDALVAASQTLQEQLASLGRPSALLTHGIDLDHWSLQTPAPVEAASTDHEFSSSALPDWWPGGSKPIILFWGLIDRRLDTAWCEALVNELNQNNNNASANAVAAGRLILVGPEQSPEPALQKLPRVIRPGPVSYDYLPLLAAAADVLVMPYADLPVTRAMQPLKFKEYLATGKPVVVRNLPATKPWSDAADVVDTVEEFVGRVRQRLQTGLPESQERARLRLEKETWQHKADAFEAFLFDQVER